MNYFKNIRLAQQANFDSINSAEQAAEAEAAGRHQIAVNLYQDAISSCRQALKYAANPGRKNLLLKRIEDYSRRAEESSAKVKAESSAGQALSVASALRVLQNCKYNLQLVSDQLRDEKRVVLNAVAMSWGNLQYASDRLRDDESVVLTALRCKSLMAPLRCEFRDASWRLQDDKRVVMLALKEDIRSIKYASRRLRNDKECIIGAVTSNGLLLDYASEILKNDKEVVLAAIKGGRVPYDTNISVLQFASDALRDDKEVVITAIVREPKAMTLDYVSDEWANDDDVAVAVYKRYGELWSSHAPKAWRNSRGVILTAIRMGENSLKYATEAWRGDKEVVLTAIEEGGLGNSLKYASVALRNDEEVVMAAFARNDDEANSLRYASLSLRGDKIFLSKLAGSKPFLQHASEPLRDDKELVKTTVQQNGTELRFASDRLKNDKEIVSEAVSNNGGSLQHASRRLRGDRDCVLLAVSSQPESLKFALGGLNQDKECLIAAGLWDEFYLQKKLKAQVRPKVVLSTRFSLHEASTPTATQFTVLLREHPYVQQERNFTIYSPNAFDKDTCDPNWTNRMWPCRGTFHTCKKPPNLKSGIPTNESCWRYSFRFQLEEAKKTNGFMVQVIELRKREETLFHLEKEGLYTHALGQGQEIESEMARKVGVKVFKVFQPRITEVDDPDAGELVHSKPDAFEAEDVETFVSAVRGWYDNKCLDISDHSVPFRDTVNYY